VPTFCKARISAPSVAAAARGSKLPLIEPDSEIGIITGETLELSVVVFSAST
jgi:hypothetical protein